MAARVIEELMKAIKQFGPDIMRTTYYERYSTPPGPAGRLQAAAGKHKGPGDAHALGRALDIMLNATIDAERDIANQLVDVFLLIRPRMRWDTLIYNKKIWNKAGLKFPKGGTVIEQHITHIHIDWSEKTVDEVDPDDFKPLLISMLMQVR